MLRRKINKATYESLSDADKAHYKPNASGDYVLDLEGEDDALEGMARAKKHESDARKAAEQKAAELEAELSELRSKAKPKTSDIEALESSYKEKIKAQQSAFEARLSAIRQNLVTNTIESAAKSLASELFTSEVLGLPHVKSRLSVEFDDRDVAALRILGPDGKPSAATIDDLKKELLTNEAFAPILKSTSASGGGAPVGNPVGSSIPLPADPKRPITGISPGEIAELTAFIEAKEKAGGYK